MLAYVKEVLNVISQGLTVLLKSVILGIFVILAYNIYGLIISLTDKLFI